MGKEVQIEKSNIEIADNVIRFKTTMPIINFAACWQEMYDISDFIKHKTTNIRGYGNIPPIQYAEEEDKYHLKIELFQNRFVRIIDTLYKKYFITNPR